MKFAVETTNAYSATSQPLLNPQLVATSETTITAGPTT